MKSEHFKRSVPSLCRFLIHKTPNHWHCWLGNSIAEFQMAKRESRRSTLLQQYIFSSIRIPDMSSNPLVFRDPCFSSERLNLDVSFAYIDGFRSLMSFCSHQISTDIYYWFIRTTSLCYQIIYPRYIMTHTNNYQHNGSKCWGGNPSRPASPKIEVGLGNEDALDDQDNWKWETDPNNPYNWPTMWKVQQVMMIASAAFKTWAKLPLIYCSF